MSLVQLFVPTEVAHDTVSELGELGNVQFKDVMPAVLAREALTHPNCSSTQALILSNAPSLGKFVA